MKHYNSIRVSCFYYPYITVNKYARVKPNIEKNKIDNHTFNASRKPITYTIFVVSF